MNAICYGGISVVMSGVIQKNALVVPVINERQRQTYFGALNYYTQEFWVKPYKQGNSQSAVAFVQYLLRQYPKSRIALIWDGASYHRSAE
jgi:hypothetical protein